MGKRREIYFPRSLEVCFKVKLKQEGSFDFKQCFKVKDPFQMLLLSRFYCDGNDMLRGKWWFYLDAERKNFAMIDVPYEGQTTKSLTHSLSNSVELGYSGIYDFQAFFIII